MTPRTAIRYDVSVNRAVVITVSDRVFRGQSEDRTGPVILAELPALDATLIHREVAPNDPVEIQRLTRDWLGRCDVLLSTGGCGVEPNDRTPDALAPLIDRPLPGFGEIMRTLALAASPARVLSRCGAGLAGDTLIVWLPGARASVKACLDVLAAPIREVCQTRRSRA